MRIEVFGDPPEVAREAAAIIAAQARNAVAARGRFNLAVSGGRTSWLMYGTSPVNKCRGKRYIRSRWTSGSPPPHTRTGISLTCSTAC